MGMNRNLWALVEQEVKGSGGDMTISSAAALAVSHSITAAFMNKKAVLGVLRSIKQMAATKSEQDYGKVMDDIFELVLKLQQAAVATHLAASAAGKAINTANDSEAKSLENQAENELEKVIGIADDLKR